MNCWNTLRAHRNHNVAGNGEREGLRIRGIGQSAAKSLSGFEPTDVITKPIDTNDLFFGQFSTAPRHDLVAFDGVFGLRLLASQIGQDVFEQVIGEGVVKHDFVGSLAGFKRSGLNVSVAQSGDVLDSLPLAHSDFDNYPKLESVSGSIWSGEFSDSNTPLTINDSCNVSSISGLHKTSWLTSNDYPETEYGQAPGRMRQSQHTVADYIVFSAMKVAAVENHQFDGAWNSEHARKYKAYLGDDYYALAWPTTLRTFKNNLETIHQYSDTGFKLIMNGEIGRYENARYVEQTNITKGISTDGINSTSTGTNGAWANNLSDWIFFFGNDTVAEAIATPEEMRGKIPSDYGRSKGVAWYYLGGFGIVHTLAQNCRIVKWDSAA